MPDRAYILMRTIEPQLAIAENNGMHEIWMTTGFVHEIVDVLKEQEAVKPQDAEMLIVHNGGAEEYVKDIESIVLLAHKDYDIVYCGKFSEGR